MHAIRVASAALLSMIALSFSAPVAVADHGDGHNITLFGFRVQPSTISAGDRVELLLNKDGGCKGSATVSSGVFDTVTIRPGQSSATATVDRDAQPGAVYEVTFKCDGVSDHTELTIATGRQDDATPAAVSAERDVRAGVGGSVGGLDFEEIGLGTVLITGSVGGAWYMWRRRAAADDS
ncbi:lipoprotein [Streptomyces albiflavescens]|uniref:Lipoprotein n=1 Tax=Streptomyces albiflavescens TaxID=1623582 RepID=A0A917XZA5_9ACTN|nr:hypothetical protein [Streptomyces albiflavescens]GGN58057.1 lipoprotein [Streptomyces albiflavescens]